MTIDDAKNNIGNKVIYERAHCKAEYGVITSVNSRTVFVRYGTNVNSQGTDPEDLTLDK